MSAQRPTQRESREARKKASRNNTGRTTSSRDHKPTLETIDDASSVATLEIHEPAEISGCNHVFEANDIYSYADDLRESAAKAPDESAAARPTSKGMAAHGDDDSRPSTSHPSDLKTEPLDNSGQRQDAGEVLRLMRATKGLMHGSFFYRYGSDHSWVSSSGYISPQIGSLLHYTGSRSVHDALVADLRTCHVTAVIDQPSQQIFLRLHVRETRQEVHFCPRDNWYFNAWFAALLTWQSIPPRSLMPGKSSPRRPQLLSGFIDANQQGKMTWRDTQTLRQESIILLEPSYSPTATSAEEFRDESQLIHAKLPRDVKQIKSLCLLRGSGLLSLYIESQSKQLATVQIKDLSRSAIQRVDYSIFHSNHVIVIRPRCSASAPCGSRIAPLYLSCPTRESMETWIVVLQTFTIPEVYGSQELFSGDEVSSTALSVAESAYQTMVRMKHNLIVRINKVRLFGASKRSSKTSDSLPSSRRYSKYYIEVLLDHQVYIVTNGYTWTTDKLHFFETHTMQDVPSQFSTITIRIRRHEQTRPASKVIQQGSSHEFNESFTSLKIQRGAYVEDEYCGEVVFESHELETLKGVEQTLPLLHQGESVGELTFEVEHQEEVIMMEPEYEHILEFFEKMPVALSLAYSEQIRPAELPKLAERLLNVFLVSGNATDWLMALAEREILGPVGKIVEQKAPEARENSRSTSEQVAAASSYMVLLFRGNTLFTKALDLYMKRVGQNYLETTLRKKMREIAIYEPECEVDPSKLTVGSNLDKNWRRLIDVTTETWQLIHQSAEQCPMELRVIFRRIRDYACQRYGKSAPMVKYTSVSGFLFLRFFAAATLNPHLFGLIEDDTANSAPTAHRCFMLVAKSLQGLANMTTFGSKEIWMAPMEQFVSSHREDFKNFINTICDVDEDYEPPVLGTHLIAHSATRSQYMNLSRAARDGILSLPHLIDRSRDIAALVRIWVDRAQKDQERLSFVSARNVDSSASVSSAEPDIPSFHAACLRVHKKTQEIFDQVDREEVDDVSAALFTKWETIAERMETRPSEFWVAGCPKTQRTDAKGGETGGGKLPFFFPRKPEKDRSANQSASKATSQGSSGSSEASDKKSRKKSPQRNAPDNAMRKLGWM